MPSITGVPAIDAVLDNFGTDAGTPSRDGPHKGMQIPTDKEGLIQGLLGIPGAERGQSKDGTATAITLPDGTKASIYGKMESDPLGSPGVQISKGKDISKGTLTGVPNQSTPAEDGSESGESE